MEMLFGCCTQIIHSTMTMNIHRGRLNAWKRGGGYGMRMRQMYVDMGVVKGVRVLREIVDMAQ